MRFYTAVRAENEIYPVRRVALHRTDTDIFDLSGNVYDVIFEKQQQGAATPLPLPENQNVGAERLPDTINILDLLKLVKSSDGKIYRQKHENNPKGAYYDKPSLEAIDKTENKNREKTTQKNYQKILEAIGKNPQISRQ